MPARAAQLAKRRSWPAHPAMPCHVFSACRAVYSMYSRPPSTRRSPASVGFSSIPFVSGRSNETAVAPVYRLRPPKSLYAFQVLVGEDEDAARTRGPARPQHEPRGRRIRVTLPGAVQPHQVHPARPVRIGRDRHRHRPPAAVLDDRRRDLPGHRRRSPPPATRPRVVRCRGSPRHRPARAPRRTARSHHRGSHSAASSSPSPAWQ